MTGSNKRLNVLVLHGMGKPRRWFAGVADVELLFPNNDQENNYLVHNCYLPLTEIVQNFEFDAVFMTATFMCQVYGNGLEGKWIKQFDFLKHTSAIKIVFPQDDYWHSETKDAFYIGWGIHKVFPVCPPDSWPELIPRYLESGDSVEQGYTTYITDYMRNITQFAKARDERDFDVVYRASQTPTAPNHFGFIKGIIGDRFLTAIGEDSGLSCDISTNPLKLIRGSAWYKFIGASKAILGSNSGSSIRLRNRRIASKLQTYQAENPKSSLDEVEKAVIPEMDRNKSYTAISPRNLEAAMLDTVQILVPGAYGGFLEPWEDYIPLAEDCTNIDQVLGHLRDRAYCTQVATSCKRKLLGAKELNAERLIEQVIAFVRAKHVDAGQSDHANFEELVKQHGRQEARLGVLYGIKQPVTSLIRVLLPRPIKTILRNTHDYIFNG
jgi:hypothetical protein